MVLFDVRPTYSDHDTWMLSMKWIFCSQYRVLVAISNGISVGRKEWWESAARTEQPAFVCRHSLTAAGGQRMPETQSHLCLPNARLAWRLDRRPIFRSRWHRHYRRAGGSLHRMRGAERASGCRTRWDRACGVGLERRTVQKSRHSPMKIRESLKNAL